MSGHRGGHRGGGHIRPRYNGGRGGYYHPYTYYGNYYLYQYGLPDNYYLGMSLQQATSLAAMYGQIIRVVEENGIYLETPGDHNNFRINVAIYNGIVVKIIDRG